MSKQRFGSAALFVGLLGLAILLRMRGWLHVSGDMRIFLIPWYNALGVLGFHHLARAFSNYAPPYLYLLWLMTFTKSFLSQVAGIKLLSVLFDAANAVLVYKIARVKYPQGLVPVVGAGIFLLLPTVVLNGAWWGQSDAIYTFFLLASFYMILQERSLSALLYFGVAFSFKLQAVFLGPFLLLLTFRKRIAWGSYLLVPVVYLVMMLPALLVGRPLLEVLTIYLDQAGTYKELSMKAPNLYQFISNTYYNPVSTYGFVLAVMFMLGWAFLYSRRPVTLSKDSLMLSAALSLALVPFFLPKMHERYFYPSDVFLLLLALYIPRLWYVPLVAQVVSFLTYSVYLFTSGVYPFLSETMLYIAAALNVVLIGYLLWEQFRLTETSDEVQLEQLV